MLHRLIIVSAFILLLLFIWGAYRLYRHNTRLRRRLNLLLDSLDNADTSIRFPEKADPEINQILNRIALNLSDLRSQISQNEKFYETILRDISTGVIIASPSGYILRANPAALRLLNRPALTHINALRPAWPDLTDVLSPLRPGIDATVRNLAVKTTAFTPANPSVEHQPTESDSPTPASYLYPKKFLFSINTPLIIVTIDDITSQLDTANVKTWMDMIRILTHEIMNGIAPVTSIADTLLARYAPAPTESSTEESNPEEISTLPTPLIDGLNAICESTRGLNDFVTRYRALTNIPAPEATTFPLIPFLHQTIALASQSTPQSTSAQHPAIVLIDHNATGLETNPQYPVSSDPLLTADRDQLRQVLLNIIKNAIEANARRITLRVSSGPGRIMITIENDGDPIDSDIAEHIFTPYFTTKTTGSGIGLSISRRLIIANGGSLTLTTSPGTHTTRFTITLPYDCV